MTHENVTKEELLSQILEMERELTELRNLKAEFGWLEESLKKRTQVLNERIKELNCLFGVLKLMRRRDVSLDENVRGILALMPTAWQHPQDACARAVIRDREFKTAGFRETDCRLSAGITADGLRIGTLEVCYLHKRPGSDEGPFLNEERTLLNVIAECLGMLAEAAEEKAGGAKPPKSLLKAILKPFRP